MDDKIACSAKSKELHSGQYAARFESGQDIRRVMRLLERISWPRDAVIADFG